MATRARWACTPGHAKLQEGIGGAGGNFLATVFMVTMALLFGFAAAPSAARAACVGNAPNGLLQAGEECDDNDMDDHDFCRNNCTLARCGDSVKCTKTDCSLSQYLSGTEYCDEGGETATCDANCTKVDCGDGDLNTTAGEECDDNNTTPLDGCNASCKDEYCGDGIKNDAGAEECDDGDTDDGDGCLNNCKWADCGDGVTCTSGCSVSPNLTGPEDCDDAGESKDCNADCTTAACGDAKVNATAGEECDDGDSSNGDYCLNTCLYASCGDKKKCSSSDCNKSPNLDGPEDCDAGGETTTCDANCTTAACPDGDLNTTRGEECDDGNYNNTDTCNASCELTKCGDGTVQSLLGEECDDGDATCSGGQNPGDVCKVQDDCKGTCPGTSISPNAVCQESTSEQICGYPTSDPKGCGRGDGLGIGTCSWTANRDDVADHCRTNCLNAYCGDTVHDTGETCDDGNTNNSDKCIITDLGGQGSDDPLNCRTATCGDGYTCSTSTCDSGYNSHPEECDDGASNSNTEPDTCRKSAAGDSPGKCMNPICGDGVIDSGEECDDGSSNSDTTPNVCREDCTLPSCGDSVIDTASPYDEDCDDGADNGDNKPCTSDCKDAVCGDSLLCDDPSCDTGPGHSNPGNQPEQCDDGKPMVCDGNGNVPEGTECTADSECGPGGSCTTNGDGCSDVCRSELCGDGIPDPQEDCDDGNTLGGDGCDSACVKEECGNGKLQLAAGEECDDGNQTAHDGCDDTHPASVNCVIEFCGDADTDAGLNEECDDGNSNSDTDPGACRTNCKKAHCGDGVTDTASPNSEECDDGADNGDNMPCTSKCKTATCGDALVCSDSSCDTGPNNTPEQCDDGTSNNSNDPDHCRAECALPVCGDTYIDTASDTNDAGGEQCDDGTTGSPDCTPQCCNENISGYESGLDVAKCDLATVDFACDLDTCRRSRGLRRAIVRMQKRLDRAGDLADIAQATDNLRKLDRAERFARSVRRAAMRLADRADRTCPKPDGDPICVANQFTDLAHMLIDTESKLALNQQ